MALVPCPECGQPLSTAAKSCPHCGWVTPSKLQRMAYRLLEKAALKAEEAAQPKLIRKAKVKRPKPSTSYTPITEVEERARIDALARRLDAIKKRQKD